MMPQDAVSASPPDKGWHNRPAEDVLTACGASAAGLTAVTSRRALVRKLVQVVRPARRAAHGGGDRTPGDRETIHAAAD
jgi:hypothetical protein